MKKTKRKSRATRKRGAAARARPRRRTKRATGARRRALMVKASLWLLLAIVLWAGWQGAVVYHQFQGRLWTLPARVFASPLEIYPGSAISRDEFVEILEQLGYQSADGRTVRPATWWRSGNSVRMTTRPFRFPDGPQPNKAIQIDFGAGSVRRIRSLDGNSVPLLRLDPLEIGSIFPVHGEDRLVLEPGQIPGILRDALMAIEDQNFNHHHGVDPLAVLRAFWVNLRSGEIRQGGSTLTQQLIKNYFLDNRRTIGRKLREAVMALWLDGLFSKEEIFTAYVNEIYLGQDGRRAVHGFGLASRFYFGRPLSELGLPETALLVALVRGPSYYNPWNNPERALARRNLVLDVMEREGVLPAETADAARLQPLALASRHARSGYYPAYLDMVRKHLATDYERSDLATEGLSVFTALEPSVQTRAEQALNDGILKLARDREGLGGLDGAVVVTRIQTGEVQAVVGGRRAGQEGFNRALSARRPIGSLIKPAVFLAAIESAGYSMASLVEDQPITVELDTGQTWSPANFEGSGEGQVTLVEALARSLNLATVHVGLDVGIDKVIDVLQRLGFDRDIKPYPSLLLGAVEMSPVMVAQVYSGMANEGFRVPLRTVREVIDESGRAVTRYGIELSQTLDRGVVSQVNSGLIQVMTRGTGRSAARYLHNDLDVAGKSGTSDDFRDSWFAGFTGDNVVVVWLGHDDGTPTGLTGSTGALPIWSEVVNGIGGSGFRRSQVDGVVDVWIDYETGELATENCGEAVLLTVPADIRLRVNSRCDVQRRNIAERALDWLKRLGDD